MANDGAGAPLPASPPDPVDIVHPPTPLTSAPMPKVSHASCRPPSRSLRSFSADTATTVLRKPRCDLWSAGVSLRWTLDFGAPATVGTAERAMERARADAELARQRAETRIYEAWHQARSALARARAARAAASLRERALDAARAEYRSGRSTQLALSRAQRDLLEAQGDRVRADADLAVARLTLRLESGLPPQPEVSP